MAMDELYKNYQDPDEILNLEPEELAEIVLFILKEEEEKEFSLHNCVLEIPFAGERQNGEKGYPLALKDEIHLAVSEAFACLRTQNLIVEKPENSNGTQMVLSRRARKMEMKGDFQQFMLIRRFNRAALHPQISEETWNAVLRGELADAISSAMRAVEIAVREAGKFDDSLVGIKLISAAFGPEGTLRDQNALKTEEDGIHHLFMGAMKAYRNPHAHRRVHVKDAIDAMDVVMQASHLLRIVDSRRVFLRDGADDHNSSRDMEENSKGGELYSEQDTPVKGKANDVGTINKNNQMVKEKTNLPGHANQKVHRMECLDCGHNYGANGYDCHLRKCPKCGGGAPGLPYE